MPSLSGKFFNHAAYRSGVALRAWMPSWRAIAVAILASGALWAGLTASLTSAAQPASAVPVTPGIAAMRTSASLTRPAPPAATAPAAPWRTQSGALTDGFFSSFSRAGVADGAIAQIVSIFSGVVDFHQRPAPGDYFKLISAPSREMHGTNGTNDTKGTRVLAVELYHAGKAYHAIWFAGAPGSGQGAYYDIGGRNVRRALLRLPVTFSRVSSGFGHRTHPVLGTWTSHTGIDLAAPTGTPVVASADGIIAHAGPRGAYGNLAIIRHNGNYLTYYGHLARLASGLKPGTTVAAGQVIGYVGQTGRATGPHLHYELRLGSRPVDPSGLMGSGTPRLQGAQLQAFQQQAARLVSRIAQLAPALGTAIS